MKLTNEISDQMLLLFFFSDIYHRILRFKNYLVAMVNKELLPLKFRLPFVGEQYVVLFFPLLLVLDRFIK